MLHCFSHRHSQESRLLRFAGAGEAPKQPSISVEDLKNVEPGLNDTLAREAISKAIAEAESSAKDKQGKILFAVRTTARHEFNSGMKDEGLTSEQALQRVNTLFSKLTNRIEFSFTKNEYGTFQLQAEYKKVVEPEQTSKAKKNAGPELTDKMLRKLNENNKKTLVEAYGKMPDQLKVVIAHQLENHPEDSAKVLSIAQRIKSFGAENIRELLENRENLNDPSKLSDGPLKDAITTLKNEAPEAIPLLKSFLDELQTTPKDPKKGLEKGIDETRQLELQTKAQEKLKGLKTTAEIDEKGTNTKEKGKRDFTIAQVQLEFGVSIEEKDGKVIAVAPKTNGEMMMNKFSGFMGLIEALITLMGKKEEIKPKEKEVKKETLEETNKREGLEKLKKAGATITVDSRKSEQIDLKKTYPEGAVFGVDSALWNGHPQFLFKDGKWLWKASNQGGEFRQLTMNKYSENGGDDNVNAKCKAWNALATDLNKGNEPIFKNEEAKAKEVKETKNAEKERIGNARETAGDAYLKEISGMTKIGAEWQYDTTGFTEYYFHFNTQSNLWEWHYENDNTYHPTEKIPADKWQDDPTLQRNREVPIPESYRSGGTGIDWGTQDLNDEGLLQAIGVINRLNEFNKKTYKEKRPEGDKKA